MSPATTRGIRFLSRRWARGWRQPRFLFTDLPLPPPASPTNITADPKFGDLPAREALLRIQSSVSLRRETLFGIESAPGRFRGNGSRGRGGVWPDNWSRDVGDRTDRTRRCRDYRGAATFPMRSERCREDLGARSVIRDGGRGRAAAGGIGIAGMSRPRSAPQRRHENRLLVKGIRVR